MQGVYDQILSAAASDATVIVYGEPGTGKELVAHAVHDMSQRRNGRLVPVHCGAIPENLVESEFFGYRKGAFSGAEVEKSGYLDHADGGTLFLDEIGEISLNMQVKLLRAIDGGGYTPVGGAGTKHANFRIIAATNRNLMDLIDHGRMREDFFYRIHILPIHLPPLRQRKEDIPLLVDHFFLLHRGKQNIPPLTGASMDQLMNHHWPGNVRELQNVILRYCALKRIDLNVQEPFGLSAAMTTPAGDDRPAGSSLRGRIDILAREAILNCLEKNRWNRSQTARQLGIDRKTLIAKIKQYKID
jgi:transcriptional regulator with PAS, ATPase and Fis domain